MLPTPSHQLDSGHLTNRQGEVIGTYRLDPHHDLAQIWFNALGLAGFAGDHWQGSIRTFRYLLPYWEIQCQEGTTAPTNSSSPSGS